MLYLKIFFCFSFIYGKAKNHLIRICGILKILENAIEIIENNPEFLKLTKDEFVKSVLKNSLDLTINIKDIEKATKINEYFLKIKLTISNFEQNGDTFSYTISNKLISTKGRKSKDSVSDVKFNILNSKGKKIPLTLLSLNREANKNTFMQAAEELNREGFR
jgi:hypothetical protein